MLSQKKKDQALQLIINYSLTDKSHSSKNETGDLLFLAGQTFLTKEAQEEYENSLNLTLENEKAALKAAEHCLGLEPQNLDCMIQKARLNYRAKNEKNFKASIGKVRDLLESTNFEKLFGLLLEKNEPEFKNQQSLVSLSDAGSEHMLTFVLLELDRCFAAKNYSRAKDLITTLEKIYSDWPDLLYYKNKLNIESEEDSAKSGGELLSAYASKCKSITKSAARKYRYDFELCARGGKS